MEYDSILFDDTRIVNNALSSNNSLEFTKITQQHVEKRHSREPVVKYELDYHNIIETINIHILYKTA